MSLTTAYWATAFAIFLPFLATAIRRARQRSMNQ